ncbi:MAG: c-type cytochrome [Pseudomonadota bacterium]|nr:c-type cytochrome [Pseudomonadota bacterium]
MRMHKSAWPHLVCGMALSLPPLLLFTACGTVEPPAQRATVTLPVLEGDLALGKEVYQRDCQQCHQIQIGLNKKGPHLDRIYGATAAALADYQGRYSQALKQSGWTWDAVTLDTYIADPDQALPNGKMLADPLTDPIERAALIAYLSTLRSTDQPTASQSQ